MRGAVQLVACCCAAVSLALPAGASAIGPGAPGKVATLAPGQPVRVWDPVKEAKGEDPWTTLAPLGYPTAGPDQNILTAVARPQWSRDGTKLVYTVSEVDPGDPDELGRRFNQTSIWLYDVPSGQKIRLTHPQPSFTDPDPEDDQDVGHVVSDGAPTFSPDGSTVAFVRSVQAQPDDALYDDLGQQLWTVPATGGGEARRSSLPEGEDVITALQWIPGTQDILAVRATDTGTAIFRMTSGGGAGSQLGGTEDATPMGLDVSPDGQRMVFTTVSDSGFTAHVRAIGGGADIATHPVKSFPTFSPGGDGIIAPDCIDEQCGLVEKYALDDPLSRDIPLGETQRMALRLNDPGGALYDVQPQELPVVFLPGFLGSRIDCGGDSLWPGSSTGLPDLLGMRLQADGLTNDGCAAAGASGDPLRRFAGLDIYASAADFVADQFGERGAVLGWDWRKRPQEALLALDAKIDELLAKPGRWHDQGVGRVVLMGHSYGGILIRTYLQLMHPEKVAKVLTLGTPYWGSPKAIFPLAFGVETPVEGPGLDLFLRNADLKVLARNLAGLYQLFPSQHFGPWLSQDREAAVPRDVVTRLGGNGALLDQAQGYHQTIYDGFFDDDGRIDVRALVGTGEASVGGVDLQPQDDGDDRVGVRWVNGDGTVPATSAVQGPEGTNKPLGDRVHLQYQCHVEHVDLAGNAQILDAYRDWLDHDAVPKRIQAGPCPFSALQTDFEPGTLGPEPDSSRAAATTEGRTARAAGPSLNLTDAETAGLAQVLELPGAVTVVTDDARPVTLRVRLQDATFTVTPVSAGGAGTPRTYGPVSGLVEITPSAAPGDAPVVTADGAPVAPAGSTTTAPPPPGATTTVPPPPGATTTAPPPGGTAPGDAGATTPPARKASRRKPAALRLVAHATLHGRRLTLRLRMRKAGTLRVKVTRRRHTLATRRVKVRRARTMRLHVTLRHRTTRTVRVRVTLSPRSGKRAQLSFTVRPRRR